ncbi:MAG: hypothetical protein GF309_02145 [Candidatus Lokiarchaeota archaeon]|nr:hypothetical protein [Candidatus Lokiarchaeota archaeon]
MANENKTALSLAALLLIILAFWYGRNHVLHVIEISAIVFSCIYSFFGGKGIVKLLSGLKLDKFTLLFVALSSWLLIFLAPILFSALGPPSDDGYTTNLLFVAVKAVLFFLGFGQLMLDAVRRSARRYSNTSGLIDFRVFKGLAVTIGAIMILLTFLLVSRLWHPLWVNLTTLNVFWEISTILGMVYGSRIPHN